jgi:NADPH-dependent curcumin reductase CurA
MGRKNQNYVVTLQRCNGGTGEIAFELTRSKAERIIDIAESDIAKSTKKRKCTSITLDEFFTDH